MNGFDILLDGTYRIEKDPTDILSYGMQWYEFLRGSDKYWTVKTFVRPGDVWTPSRRALNNHRYVALNAGQTGINEPVWPTDLLATVIDGGVTWKENGAEDSLIGEGASSVWDVGALTASNAAIDLTGCVTKITLAGLTGGHEYVVTNTIVSAQGKRKDQSFTVVVKPN